jgi:hypothetical protein
MSVWDLTLEDVEEEDKGGTEEEEVYNCDSGESLNSCSSEGKLTVPLLSHQISENTAPKRKRHKCLK